MNESDNEQENTSDLLNRPKKNCKKRKLNEMPNEEKEEMIQIQ